MYYYVNLNVLNLYLKLKRCLLSYEYTCLPNFVYLAQVLEFLLTTKPGQLGQGF